MEFEIGCGEVTISSPPDGPRSAEPGVALLLWRWPLEEANKGKTANEARRNETETRHEANKGNDKQATKHDDTKQNGTRQDETKAAAPTAEPQGEGGGGEGKGEGEAGGGGERAGAGKLWPRVGGTSQHDPIARTSPGP